MKIPFNKPYLSGNELVFIEDAVHRGHLSGDGYYTRKCQNWLEKQTGCLKALLTHSCTAALEMAAILAGIKPGDEIIMPSYTFVSTANAFVLSGGVPVFIDIRPDTMNMDEKLIEAAITNKTKAIVPVHYAGVACEIDSVIKIAEKHNLLVIEDAAQAIMSQYRGKPLGGIGHLATLSFHETKNLHCGEGGALLINDKRFVERAEIIWQKGTNRNKFSLGQVDKYTWVDIGSSYLPSELNAAFLYAQMVDALPIIKKRMAIWKYYYKGLKSLEDQDLLQLPFIPSECEHNAHIFYIKTIDLADRTALIRFIKERGIFALFHCLPLHSSDAGLKYSRFHDLDKFTTSESERLLRLPLYTDLDLNQAQTVIDAINDFFKK